MRLGKLLLAVLLFSAALYLFLLDPESRASVFASFGVHLQHATVMVISIQGMVVGVILAIKAILEGPAVRSS